jgi:hypothetical protein
MHALQDADFASTDIFGDSTVEGKPVTVATTTALESAT